MTASASPSASVEPLPDGALRITLLPGRSSATIRVHEVVAAVRVPGEAVVRTTAVAGTLALLADGSFTTSSRATADLDALVSDSDLRDEWIKINTLQTRVYPRAEFTPLRLAGVPVPLPADGAWDGTLEGTLRIHGVARAVAWTIHATRTGDELHVTGTTPSFRFGDYGMAVPANRLILSVEDDIRLEIDVAARLG